ncbi:secretory carrier-associated membrane protein 5 [Condylostylus longicornis]|uniref:secretory carrier-associated membrane protein 5 n=1 Tax=Condylostylus longicornis TaxID=2530218 RepID=UPI00244DB786|nr:secretory carrier-associated membrane protein 5 [Condylostylus longicornis]
MPKFNDNPFEDPAIDNPFADPVIQNATRNSNTIQNSIEDYNPFEHDQFVQQKTNNTNNSIATMPTTTYNTSSQQPPPTTKEQQKFGNTPISTEELQRRQEELDRKAAELDRREQQLQGREGMQQLNNWPPLPAKCCFKPCFYQDINVEIPSEFQQVVRRLYYAWMFYALAMFLNIIGGLLILFRDKTISTFLLSIFYCFLFTPASYLCWFRPVYKAFKSDSSFNFMVFFFVYFFQTIITIFQTIGIPSLGYCGYILAFEQMNNGDAFGIFVGIILLLIAICFTICSVLNVMLITKVHAIYRSSGASMAKAQAEFTNNFMSNRHVQQAASSAMSSAMNSQFNNRY